MYMPTSCILRITTAEGVAERRALFYRQWPSIGATLELEGYEITITGSGMFNGRNIVFASSA